MNHTNQTHIRINHKCIFFRFHKFFLSFSDFSFCSHFQSHFYPIHNHVYHISYSIYQQLCCLPCTMIVRVCWYICGLFGWCCNCNNYFRIYDAAHLSFWGNWSRKRIEKKMTFLQFEHKENVSQFVSFLFFSSKAFLHTPPFHSSLGSCFEDVNVIFIIMGIFLLTFKLQYEPTHHYYFSYLREKATFQ